MTQAARTVFVLLVAAAFGAFFLAQRLKHTSPVVGDISRGPVVSGNGDGRSDSVRFSFRLKQTDTVDVSIVNDDGVEVRRIAEGQHLASGFLARYIWDGKDQDGHVVPDGFYKPRVSLRGQGRTLTFPRGIRSDVTAPKPTVLSVGPDKHPTAEYVPTSTGRPVTIQFVPQGQRPRVSIWRTDTPTPMRVASSGRTLAATARTWQWDGTVGGRPAPEGTYVALVDSRDEAGNVGYSIPVTGADRHPAIQFARRFPGRAGITVRYLAVQPPSAPVIAGTPTSVGVDARGRPYRWTLRRLGARRTTSRSDGSTSTAPLKLTAPTATGVYLLKVTSGQHVETVPLAVQRSIPVGRVLVVLPWLSWQARNPVDDDGDGRANTLPAGVGVRVDRPFAGGGLPAGFANRVAPLLVYLDRKKRPYDLTTDVALLRGQGPKLDEFGGVMLVGDETWLPANLGAAFRTLVRAGGNLVSFGTDSLRRQVSFDGKRLTDPTAQSPTDVFGARLQDVPAGGAPGALTVKDDRIDLFSGTAGSFPGVSAREETLGGANPVASAVTPSGRAVIVASAFGRGVVIRTGLPDLASRLLGIGDKDDPYAQLVDQTWTLASRGVSQR